MNDIAVGLLEAEYVAAEARDAASLRARFDRLIPRVVEECARRIAGAADGTVVIERLEVEATVDGDADDAEAVRRWGGALAAAVGDALGGGPGVVRFRGDAEYLARFVEDVARGNSAGRWVYQPLAPLRRSSRGGTIAAAFARHAPIGLRILTELRRSGALDGVLTALTAADAAAIVRSLAPAGSPAAWSDDVVAAIEAAAPRVWPALARPLASTVNWIRLMAWIAGEHPGAADHPSAGPIAAEALRIAARLGRGAADLWRDGVEAIWNEADSLDAAASLRVRPPRAVRAALRRTIAPVARGAPAAGRRAGSGEAERAVEIVTNVGGFFLLVRDLLESGIIGRLACVSAVDGLPGDRLGLYLLALALAGPHARQVRGDPGAARFAGLESPPAPAILERAAACDPAALLAGDPPGDPVATVVPEDRGPVLVVRDEGGAWRFAARADDRATAGAALAEAGRLLGAPVRRAPWAGEPILSRDVAHLFAAALPGVPPRLRAALAVLARNVLARFAGRLAGFAGSSAPYLVTNFLYGRSTIALDDERACVTLPATPLQVVLRLYGAGEVASVPWLGGRRLTFMFG